MGDHDVRGLQIAVDDRALVRARQGVENLAHQPDRLGRIESPLLLEDRLEGAARDVLEGRIEQRIGFAGVVDQAHDVGVRQMRAQMHLAAEAIATPRGELLRLVGVGAQHLDGRELTGGDLTRLEDPPEAATAELREDLVAAELLADLRRLRGSGGRFVHLDAPRGRARSWHHCRSRRGPEIKHSRAAKPASCGRASRDLPRRRLTRLSGQPPGPGRLGLRGTGRAARPRAQRRIDAGGGQGVRWRPARAASRK